MSGKKYSFKVEGHLNFPSFMKSSPFGSATVLEEGADLDYLVFNDNLARVFLWLLQEGFTFTGTDLEYIKRKSGPSFTTFRKGVYNIIVMHKYESYRKYIEANKLCVELRLTKKEDRVRVFQLVGDTNLTELEENK